MFSLRPSGALSAVHITHIVKEKRKGHPDQRERPKPSTKYLMHSVLRVDISEHGGERKSGRCHEEIR